MGTFVELGVFEQPQINELCDEIFKIYGPENLFVCGSVATIFHGDRKEYRPKDIDMVASTGFVFEQIKSSVDSYFPDFKIFKNNRRCIIYTPFAVIEIWKRNRDSFESSEAHLYKNRIPYLIN